MTSQESQLGFDLNLYFVIPSKYDSENDCKQDTWNAFNKCDELELSPQWITETRCHRLEPGKKDVFVMEEFEGDLFNELKKFRCSIIGPLCLLTCFVRGEPIPAGSSPTYCTAMRGLVVSASGFSLTAKERIRQKVEYMGGIYTRELRSSVTHLVTDSVISAKYERAVELGISILTEEWVNAVWEVNSKQFLCATDSTFNEYKCPVFMNLVVSSTNLPKQKKEELKRLINDNGGTFMGALDGSKVKILIAPEKSSMSEKLKFARQYGIACVKAEWVHRSIEVGYALPDKDFRIESSKAYSTPKKSQGHETLNLSTISAIPGDLNSNDCVDETIQTTMSLTRNTIVSTTTDRCNAPYIQVLEKLDVAEAKMAGPFLDGCCIYLVGFPSNHRDKLNRILNVGSATRLNDMSDALTHVLVGDPNKASCELKIMDSKGLSPYVLNVDWLAESIKIKRPAAEECFLFEQRDSTGSKSIANAPSPLSKKNLQMLQPPRRPPVPPFDVDTPSKCSDNNDEQDLTQQYLQKSVDNQKTLQEFLTPYRATPTNAERDTAARPSITEDANPRNGESKEAASDSTVPISQDADANARIFKGMTFFLTGFDDQKSEELTTDITMSGGRAVPSSFVGIPDFGIVPLLGATLKYTVSEIVTDLFIEDCLEQEQVVDIMYYHRPVSINKNNKLLASCVVTMSSYTGKERVYLSQLVEALGGRYQDTLAHKTNVEKNTYGSTHLVCPIPEGKKYDAAVKWRLPAVTAEWLTTCAAEQSLVDETPYLVGETMAPDRPKPISSTIQKLSDRVEIVETDPTKSQSTPVARQVLTPKRRLQNVQNTATPEVETPIINKRLSLSSYKTPPSPFHVSTPDTPYGQIFKSNPSPDTRKGWVKWIDNLPDMRVEEPPLKRRPPSTPLSELKRQLWEKLKNPEDEREEGDKESTAQISKPAPPVLNEAADSKDTSPTNQAPIKRILTYADENSPIQENRINFQLAQLDRILQATASTSESRLSSTSNAMVHNLQTIDIADKCMAKETQPDTVGWEEPGQYEFRERKLTTTEEEAKEVNSEANDSEEAAQSALAMESPPPPPPPPKFMISGVRDRSTYEAAIRSLGGDVSSETNYDTTATHLLCIRPSRNEKMLCSIAAGKWVLHCIYLRDCEQEGRFLDEEKYEWGNPKSKGIIPDPTEKADKLIASAVYRWRLKLLEEPGGAFRDMVALLLVVKEKYDQFERLIHAGGGTVVRARPPYNTSPGGKKITHCFVQVKQLDRQVDWAMMASKGILCFLPQYLSDHLTAESPLNPRDSVLPEFKKYLTLVPKHK